ncbi:MAG: rhamnulose-1-phosphate aldolase [Clostridia bacterium]|nr:rhamnulose-1-phosphate aldolase [Clostridia bacterium]
MKNILNAPFVVEMCETTANMYRLGWDERNGGNISCLLDQSELEQYLNVNDVIRTIPTGFDAAELAGKIFIVTGTGKYFKNVQKDPETNLGIVRISKDGKNAELLWGFKDGGKFTSEFPAHMMSHIVRLKQDPEHRVVAHSHPTYTIAMNTVCSTDEKDFTHKLWQSNTECVIVFPDGVGVLPCMVCGTEEIGIATAKKMEKHRLVVWTNHGIYGTGKNLDEAFGLIETVEKTAQIYMLALGRAVNVIPDQIIKGLADLWNLTVMEGVLDLE